MKLPKNKRGGLTTILVDFWSYIVFVFIILIFYLVFSFQSKGVAENKISESELKTKSYISLANFLKTPVDMDGDAITIAELIRLWRSNPDKYEEILSQKSKEILDKMEYEYKNPNADNILIRGFNVIINSRKKEDHSLDHLIDISSNSFQSGYVIRNPNGVGLIQAEQFIPVNENQNLYIVLMESARAK